MSERRARPRDTNALFKLIVDIAVGEEEDVPDKRKDPSRVERGRKGGLKGGKIRAAQMKEDVRLALTKKAAQARWSD